MSLETHVTGFAELNSDQGHTGNDANEGRDRSDLETMHYQLVIGILCTALAPNAVRREDVQAANVGDGDR